jgi:hypothetical protein
MQFRRWDLADLSYFMEIAKQRSFRRAGLELGISASALSHSLRGLERFGAPARESFDLLVCRTTLGEHP